MNRPVSTLPSHSRCRVPNEFRLITVEPLVWSNFYEHMDLTNTIAEFISYHREKGSQSEQWEDTFLGFCDFRLGKIKTAERIALNGQDTLGFPLDPVKRAAAMRRAKGAEPGDPGYRDSAYWHDRFMVHRDEGAGFQEAAETATKDHDQKYPTKEDG